MNVIKLGFFLDHVRAKAVVVSKDVCHYNFLVKTVLTVLLLILTIFSISIQGGNWMELKDMNTSLSDRLAYLKQLIRSNEEEEMACKMHLSTLLDMVDA